MTNKNTGQIQKLISENLQWHFRKTTGKIKKLFSPTTSTPEVQTVGVGLAPVPSKTVALEVRKVGLRRRITKLTPTLPTKTGNKYKALGV